MLIEFNNAIKEADTIMQKKAKRLKVFLEELNMQKTQAIKIELSLRFK